MNPEWLTQTLPNVTKRILALILFALKFHFGLDDQFEVYHSHNVKLIEGMQRIDGKKEDKFFDVQSWIRLSKLRLDYLMSTNYIARDQYKMISNIGTPDLSLAAKLQRIRDINRKSSSFNSPDLKFKELSRLLKDLSVENVRKESVNLTLSPLLENSKIIIEDPEIDQNVKKAVQNLLNMTKFSLKLHAPNNNVKKVLYQSYGVKRLERSKKKQMVKLNIQKNHETNLGLANNITDKNVLQSLNLHAENLSPLKEKVVYKTKKSVVEEYLYDRNKEKCNYFAPNPKVQLKERFAKVTKKYWMTSPIICRDRMEFAGPKEMLNSVLLTSLPEHFSWTLQYFSSYGQIPIGDLLDELVSIENMILSLDEDYFGYQNNMKVKANKKGK